MKEIGMSIKDKKKKIKDSFGAVSEGRIDKADEVAFTVSRSQLRALL